MGPLPHFWESSGFCPPDPHPEESITYDMGEAMRQNLIFIASIPYRDRWQVRIHWLLDLVLVDGFTNGQPVFNFTQLDELFDYMVSLRLKPGFELMGSPSGLFTDFDNATQVIFWRDLVKEVAQHYIARYGLDEVATWNFESWNEPACQDYDNLTMTITGFLNYWDACSEGLLAADPSLVLGGPADGCSIPSTYLRALLEHCVNGTNFFTNTTGSRIDFLSIHIKGSDGNDGTSERILEGEVQFVEWFKASYPSLSSVVPIVNDESDPMVGWDRIEAWRADARYPGMMASVVASHLNSWINSRNSSAPTSGVGYRLLSFDSAFLNYGPVDFFSMRTLSAIFQMNNSDPVVIETVRKQSANVLGMFSMLGSVQLAASIDMSSDPDLSSHIGVVASAYYPSSYSLVQSTTLAGEWDGNNLSGNATEVSVLLYYSDDSNLPGLLPDVAVSLSIPPLSPTLFSPSADMVYCIYMLNNTLGSAYLAWMELGSPVFPSASQLEEIRESMNLVQVVSPTSWTPSTLLPLTLALQDPSVLLVHICSNETDPPLPPTNVLTHQVSSNETLVYWSLPTGRCIEDFLISFHFLNGSTVFLGSSNTMFTSWIDVHDGLRPTSSGAYAIVARDYWGRTSSNS